jgi:hypothetical protein
MPPRKRAESSRRGKPAEKGAREQPLRRDPNADPVRIHREYVQRRVGGGASPTPDAYERALDQWHRLRGAVRGPVGEVHPTPEQRAREVRRVDEEVAETVALAEPERYEGPLPATDPGDNSPYQGRSR